MVRRIASLIPPALLMLACLAFALLSCTDAGKPSVRFDSPPTPMQQAAAPGAAIDLGSVVRQVRLGFHPEAGGWSARHPTYTAIASEQHLSVRPQLLGGSARQGPAIRLETTSVGRWSQGGSDRATGRLASDGHLELSRGEAIEHLRNTEQGIHQSFAFGRMPAGDGEFEVRVHVTGAPWAGAWPEGHSFFDAQAGLGVRYGAATWVDAHGIRTPVPVLHRGEGELVIHVPAETVRASSYPAELDPIISTIIDVNQPVSGDAGGLQQLSAIAFDGVNYLVIWVDSRAIDGRYCAVYGARVTPSGEVLDKAGFEIFTTYASSLPGIAFDGTNYMVAIVDPSGNILVNRVTPAGAVLDGLGGKTIATVSAYVKDVAIAFGTNAYLLTWSDYTPGKIVGRLVDKNAAGVGAAFTICNTSGTVPRPIYDGTNFFVVWQDKRSFSQDVYAGRVSPTGTVLDPTGIAIVNTAGDQTNPVAAFDGTNDLVVWESASNIVGARVAPTGTLLDTTAVAISPVQSSVYNARPAAAYDGTNVLVSWARTSGANTDLMAARVAGSGTVLDPVGFPVSAAAGSQSNASLACSAGTCLAAWQDSRDGNTDIFGARVSSNGTVPDTNGIHISMAASEQGKPAVARGNGAYLVVWEDRWSGPDWNVYGARVDYAGNVLDPAGIVISTANADQVRPRVASNGNDYLVVWSDNRSFSTYWNIFATRVSAAGAVQDATGIKLTTTDHNNVPAVASDGTDFLVVWHADSGPGVNNLVQARRVGADGSTPDAAVLQLTPAGGATDPAVAFGGGQYLVVYDGSGVRGARVTPAGAILDTAPGIAIGMSDYPSVGYDGANFVVAARYCWYPGPPNNLCEIHARRVSGAGSVLDTSDIVLSTGTTIGYTSAPYRMGPEVAFDGVDSVIVWSDFQADKVFGAWMTPAGTVFGSGALLSTSPAVTQSPVIAGQGDGNHSLLAYCFGDQKKTIEAFRTKANVVTFKILGQPCSWNTECKSDHCVDGVCCDTVCGSSATDCQACSMAAGATADGTCGPVTDGSPCSDNSACTATDTCQAGACVGGDAVKCTASDQCHDVGVCNPGTGLCSNPNLADGTLCNDGNACTQTDTCQSGVCSGANGVLCTALDACHDPGTCDTTTGQCSNPTKPDDTACPGGTCQSGACVPEADSGFESGAGGAAGSGGQGGAAGEDAGTDAGQGGMAGTAGEAGAAGGAGASGSAGSAGEAGAAGSGGAGGSSGGSAGSAGKGGASGAGGSAGQGGAAGKGGVAGASGAAGKGGAAGASGAAGKGGSPGAGGSGGAAAGAGGTGGASDEDAGEAPAVDSSADAGGCGCRTAGSQQGAGWLAMLAAAIVLARRRRGCRP